MIEPIAQRIETFLTTAGGCAFKFQGRRGLFLDDGFKSGIVVTVMDQGVEESDVSCEAQGTVCVTVLVIVLMVVTTVGVVLA